MRTGLREAEKKFVLHTHTFQKVLREFIFTELLVPVAVCSQKVHSLLCYHFLQAGHLLLHTTTTSLARIKTEHTGEDGTPLHL